MNSVQLDNVFGALADPTRRAIIGLLSEKERSAGEVADAFDISRPAVARHLKVLQHSGIVVVRNEGRKRLNSLDPRALAPATEWIQHFDKFWDDRLARLKSEIDKLKSDLEPREVG